MHIPVNISKFQINIVLFQWSSAAPQQLPLTQHHAAVPCGIEVWASERKCWYCIMWFNIRLYMLTFLIKWSQMCDYGVSSCQLNLALPSLFVRVLKHIRPQRVRFLLRIAGHSWLPQWHRAERLRAGCKQQAIQMWIYLDIFSCSPFVVNSSWTNIEFVMIVSTASKTCFNISLKQILNPIYNRQIS